MEFQAQALGASPNKTSTPFFMRSTRNLLIAGAAVTVVPSVAVPDFASSFIAATREMSNVSEVMVEIHMQEQSSRLPGD